MGGRADAIATDATSTERETLALRSIRRGNFLVEVSRGKTSTFVPNASVHGTLDITLLGQRQSIPFDLKGARTIVGRVGIALQEQMVDDDGTPVFRNYGEPGWDRGVRTPRPRPRPMRD
ncbi:MAG: hypothetical protein NT062_08070, partial [Proteobacteria bacterium]|nr:hypothetical protein [Pseudomonadota bacterium]